MTPDRLQELIAGGETLSVEFKGELNRPLNDRELVEAVVCLANRPSAEPGLLLVGVEDNGRPTGARPRHEAGITDPGRVEALIAGRTRPSLSCRVVVVPVAGVEILAIEVPPSRTPVATSDGTYLRRALGHRGQPECVPMFFHEMQALQADRGALDYTALAVPGATWADLDPLELERFRRTVQESGRGDRSLLQLADVELAKALGAVGGTAPETIRVLGLLLFGRQESLRSLLPSHEAAFQQLAERRVEVNDFFRWPLVRLVDELEGRLRARNREQELMVGMLRVGVPDYSSAGFREALANALVHRDYTRLGTVHVRWREDHIEISNPGGFPEGITLDNLLVAGPRPRNPLLADAFKRAGIVERTGRGIDTIFEEQLRNGRPLPSYGRSTPTEVVVVLPGGEPNLRFVRLLVEEGQAGRRLNLDQVLALFLALDVGPFRADRVARLLQRPADEVTALAESLVKLRLLVRSGPSEAPAYRLSAGAAARLAAERPDLGTGSERQAQLRDRVLAHLDRAGRISRRDVVELAGISVDQAKRLLRTLVNEGVVIQHGQARGVWYGRAR